MTTLATANLPSDDEEDDDYVPVAAEEAVNDGGAVKKAGKRQRKADAKDAVAQARAVKVAKRVDDIWAQLKSGGGGGMGAIDSAAATAASGSGSAAAESGALPATAAAAPDRGQNGAAPQGASKRVSLAALCRPVQKAKSAAADQSWKAQFGLTASRQPAAASSKQNPSEAAVLAAAALEAAKTLATDPNGKVVVTETRKFAGQNIQMKKTVAAGGEQKPAQQAAAKKGLDAMLAAIQGAKKVTVLDKSKADWSVHKQETNLEADLAEHNRSSDRYIDKQDFLKRAELREYETERDKRLTADIRTRARS